MDNAFCQKCGSKLSPGAKFCISCGQVVNAMPSGGNSNYTQSQPQNAYQQQYNYRQPQPQYSYQQYYQPRPSGNKGKMIAIICSVAAVVVAAVLLIVFLGGPNIDPRDLSGVWDATLKVTQVNSDYEDYGMSNVYVGQVQDMSIDISLDKDGSGTFSPEGTGDFDASYHGGRLTAKGDSGYGLTFDFEGGVSKKGDTYAISGTWKYMSGTKTIASGTWKADMEMDDED